MARLTDIDLLCKKCGMKNYGACDICIVGTAPIVDAEEVRYGKWIFDGDYSFEYVCTECRGHVGNMTNYPYCPHCGAYMRDKQSRNAPF